MPNWFTNYFWIWLILAICWITEFAHLMMYRDEDFPGRWDKILWTAAFLAAFPIAPFAFFRWKGAMAVMKDMERLKLKRTEEGSAER